METLAKIWKLIVNWLLGKKPTEQPGENHPPEPAPEISRFPVHGLWQWVDSDLEPDLPQFLKQGVGRVYLKIMDDLSGDKLWKQAQIIPELVKNAIQVVAWGYHFSTGKDGAVRYPDSEQVIKNINAAIDLGAVGYCFDLESELEGNSERLKYLLDLVKELKSKVKKPITLYYSTFGSPKDHPSFPYKELNKVFDAMLPQIYTVFWGREHGALVEKCLADFHELGLDTIPIWPVFSCEDDSDGASYPMSAKELQTLMDKYPGSSIFRHGEKNENYVSRELVFGPPRTPQTIPTPIGSPLNIKLANAFTSKEHYNRVFNDVADWFAPGNGGSVTSNACVAFQSSNMRLCGLKVPIDAKGTSTVTKPFAEYLKNLGWVVIKDPRKLEYGDICFSKDDPDWPGYPAHVFMFWKWDGPAPDYAIIVDNQKMYSKSRNIAASGPNTPFAYALRAP